jgi:hypothetical protein
MNPALPQSTTSVVGQHQLALSTMPVAAALAGVAGIARGEDAARCSLSSLTEPGLRYVARSHPSVLQPD